MKLKQLYELLLYNRVDMPQVSNIEKAIEILKSRGIKIKKETMKPSDMKPSQHDFHQEKVDRLVPKMNPKTSKAIIMSLDDYIVDGHHRWLAYIDAGYGNDNVKIYRIQLNRRQAIWSYDDVAKMGI